MTTIVFDVDGTIVDVTDRYYWVHLQALSAPGRAIGKEAYWQLKRERVPEPQILALHYPDEPVGPYLSRRESLIESTDALLHDALIPSSLEVLSALSPDYTLAVASLRASPALLVRELERLGVAAFLDHVLSARGGSDPAQSKAELIRPVVRPGDWMVGDTEADLEAGRSLGLFTCGVTSGIRTGEFLRNLEPDFLLESIAKLPELLAARRRGARQDQSRSAH